ncbi:MAG: flippase-like domain-containing protein [Rhodothermales bacterium]|nr:flippase-like domain-containing protein [Rhodothermales bacterium]
MPFPDADPHTAASEARSGVRTAWVLAAVLISLTATALVSFVTGFDAAALWHFAERLSGGTVAVVFGLFALRLALGGLRLRHLSEHALAFRQGLRGQLAWEFFSAVTPPFVGGGPLVAIFLARDGRLRASTATLTVLSALVYEQVWTTLSVAVVLIAALKLPVFPQTMPPWATVAIVGYLLGTALWAALLVTVVFLRPEWIARFVRWAARHHRLARYRDRIEAEAADLRDRAEAMRRHGWRFHALAMLLTTAAWVARYGMLVVVVMAVVPDLDVRLFVLREVAMMVTSFATPIPGSAGGAEALYAVFLGPLLHPPSMVAPTMLVWRFLNFYIFLPLGLYLTWRGVKR